ncbi:MAG: hypothetical protein CR217_15445 [Beijerinckiaceae bacterium]|nr:MAG: hypothetical protein CR217_15445 [Beijerinckiaceae bacterium]
MRDSPAGARSVVNVAADLGALEAKGGNYMAIGHTPNLGADPIHFLWQLRQIPGILRKSGRCAKNCPQERSKISQLQDNSLQNETGN